MVNQVVLEYLRVNKGNYKLGDLKKKILASGYPQKDIDDAMAQLGKQTKGNAPSVPATINQINKTNVDMVANKHVVQPVAQAVGGSKGGQKKMVGGSGKGKKKKWLILVIVLVTILVLAGIGWGVWLLLS